MQRKSKARKSVKSLPKTAAEPLRIPLSPAEANAFTFLGAAMNARGALDMDRFFQVMQIHLYGMVAGRAGAPDGQYSGMSVDMAKRELVMVPKAK
jgi:hypothetical protein